MKDQKFWPNARFGDQSALWPKCLEAAMMLSPDNDEHAQVVATHISAAMIEGQAAYRSPDRPGRSEVNDAIDTLLRCAVEIEEALNALRAAHLNSSPAAEDVVRHMAYPFAMEAFADAFEGPRFDWVDGDLIADAHSCRLNRLKLGFASVRVFATDFKVSHITRPPNLARDNLITRLAHTYTDVTGRKPSAGTNDQPFVRFVSCVFLAMFDTHNNAPLTAKIIKGALQRASSTS